MNPDSGALRRRVVWLIAIIILLIAVGTVGYRVLDTRNPQPGWLDCLFQTVVIITTLGLNPNSVDQSGAPVPIKIFTIILILVGIGVAAYAFTTLTAFVVEGELTVLLGRRRMDREISKLENHYIVCGGGRTGTYIIRELLSTNRPFVVIDTEEAALRDVAGIGGTYPYLIGDATEESMLLKAGIDKAAGLLATLSNDRDNLFLVLTARHMKSTLRIIARGYELSAKAKLERAGADTVVYPNFIGGLRMVSVMVRPAVVGFLDQMLRPEHQQVRFEEVILSETSRMVGKTLGESAIRQKTGLLVVACRDKGGEFLYNPPPATVLQNGMELVVLGGVEQMARLHELVGA